MRGRNPFLDFVEGIAGAGGGLEGVVVSGEREVLRSERRVVLLSPHPDDECLTGLLPLRLGRELGMEVVNVPVTFGSDPGRQEERREELAAACRYLGWGCEMREDLSGLGAGEVAEILRSVEPEVIVMPHEEDWNGRHVETHRLVMGVLEGM
ncbi:MAG: PIG-L family deacetylase, partial [Verrucomicrobiota bacterium]